MRALVFSLLLLTVPSAFSQEATSARHVLEDCISTLDETVVGMEGLEEHCPGIEQALADLGLLPLLDEWQHPRIGRSGLLDLQRMRERYEQPPQTPAPDVTKLDSVLSEMQPAKAEAPPSLIERFRRWLRRLLSKQDDSSDPWLSRWLEQHSLSETARKALVMGAVLIVIALAITVIVNEIRIARRSRRKKDSRDAGAVTTFDPLADETLDLDLAARNDRPSIVLRMLIKTLVRTGRLQADRSLTHRELARRARFDDDTQYENFSRVAQLAERVVYGGERSVDDLDEIVQVGRALDSKLRRMPT